MIDANMTAIIIASISALSAIICAIIAGKKGKGRQKTEKTEEQKKEEKNRLKISILYFFSLILAIISIYSVIILFYYQPLKTTIIQNNTEIINLKKDITKLNDNLTSCNNNVGILKTKNENLMILSQILIDAPKEPNITFDKLQEWYDKCSALADKLGKNNTLPPLKQELMGNVGYAPIFVGDVMRKLYALFK